MLKASHDHLGTALPVDIKHGVQHLLESDRELILSQTSRCADQAD
jgi:hypothetical protein